MAPTRPLTKAWTPAPWRLSVSDAPPQRLFINGPNGQGIAMFFERGTVPGWENGQLAATAPELVDALVAIVTAKGGDQRQDAAEKAVALLDLLGVKHD